VGLDLGCDGGSAFLDSAIGLIVVFLGIFIAVFFVFFVDVVGFFVVFRLKLSSLETS